MVRASLRIDLSSSSEGPNAWGSLRPPGEATSAILRGSHVQQLDERVEDARGGPPDRVTSHLVDEGLEPVALALELGLPAPGHELGERELQDVGDLRLVRGEPEVGAEPSHERENQDAAD